MVGAGSPCSPCTPPAGSWVWGSCRQQEIYGQIWNRRKPKLLFNKKHTGPVIDGGDGSAEVYEDNLDEDDLHVDCYQRLALGPERNENIICMYRCYECPCLVITISRFSAPAYLSRKSSSSPFADQEVLSKRSACACLQNWICKNVFNRWVCLFVWVVGWDPLHWETSLILPFLRIVMLHSQDAR